MSHMHSYTPSPTSVQFHQLTHTAEPLVSMIVKVQCILFICAQQITYSSVSRSLTVLYCTLFIYNICKSHAQSLSLYTYATTISYHPSPNMNNYYTVYFSSIILCLQGLRAGNLRVKQSSLFSYQAYYNFTA
jgi:hypothetical protein